MADLVLTDTDLQDDDRFSRFKLIGWWDQEKLRQAKVLVIGAGALGNEILKNLALLGIGNILVADLDRVENSNLSRSVLYREKDHGRTKAEVAAEAVRDIYPEVRIHHFAGNIIHDLGLGVYHWADIVLGGLDNREARLSINRACWKVNKPWVDGAIEQIQGVARLFVPDGPCYECTMTELDWKLIAKRRSCNLLTREEMVGGKTPTTPTISSIIAGVQCQEMLKQLHGLQNIAGKGWIFQGLSTDSYLVEYQRKDDCYSHETLQEIISLAAGTAELTIRELLTQAKERYGPDTVLELARDLLEKMVCPQCKKEDPLFISLGKAKTALAQCPHCSCNHREIQTFYTIRGDESFLDKTFAQIGIPPFDIVFARHDENLFGFLFAKDAPLAMGPLADC